EIAEECNVPRVEVPPLARACTPNVELEDEIPAQLYTAVAKLLAYVYAIAEGRAHLVSKPNENDIPSGMDPTPQSSHTP
ncbi:MAG: flagellar biosynthetic protein FlhB, partial [Limnobacter sp.]|nr:flagellar biosynthetic protein FlhB [Limnobacter sp.]